MVSMLLIDSSSETLRLAIDNNGTHYQSVYTDSPKHGEVILNLLDELCSKAQCQPDNFDYLCWCRGPGSFSGIRLALSVVQVLAIGNSAKVIAISSLDALALKAFLSYGWQRVTCLIDARMNYLYKSVVCINRGTSSDATVNLCLQREEDETSISLDQICSLDLPLVATSMVGHLDIVPFDEQEEQVVLDLCIDMETLIKLAHIHIKRGDGQTSNENNPVYLHNYS